MARGKLIPVLPKNYRRIVLYAVEVAADPVVLVDKKLVQDLSERGPVTQRGLQRCLNFEVRDGSARILGFHDHAREMWIDERYAHVASYCEAQGWLEIEGEAS